MRPPPPATPPPRNPGGLRAAPLVLVALAAGAIPAGLLPGLPVGDPLPGGPGRLTAQEVVPPVPPPGELPVASAASPVDSVDNPFAGFESHELENGVLVWYGHLPGSPEVSVSLTVPYGADQDPEGKEELAHFTEHMLFSDHRGRTESEIKEEIEGRGGRRNGITFADHTFYYATVGRSDGLFALEWLSRLAEPHAMEPEVVERNRNPVRLEIQARPRELSDWTRSLLNPRWLRLPDFWEMEFGLETRSARQYDRYAALHAITPADLRDFQARYYATEAMIVTVVGDLPRDSVLAVARATFGTLESSPAPAGYDPPEDPGRFRRSASWDFGATPRYRTVFKLFEPSREEHLTLLFLRDFLQRRLDQRLRYGERKAVYGMGVQVVQRGPAMHLLIEGSVDGEDLAWARTVLEEELEALRTGAHDPATFREDRRALVERVRADHRTAEELNFLVLRNFYDRSLHPSLPDMMSFYRGMQQPRLADFARATLAGDRRVEWIWRPQPVGQAGVLVLIFLLALATVRGVGRLLTSPVDMREIRYVARIRLSAPFLAVSGALYLVVGVAAGRILLAGLERTMLHLVAPVEWYPVQMAVLSLAGAGCLALLILYLSLVPRKILVFPDHIRVKSLAYRSRLVRPEDVEELSLRGFGSLLGSGRILGTLPFTLGLLRPGIFLRLRRGWNLYFTARDPDQLFHVLTEALDRDRSESEAVPALEEF